MKLSTFIRNKIYDLVSYKNKKVIQKFILCYHSISDSDWHYSIDEKTFIKQINYLLDNFTYLTMEELKNIVNGKANSNAKPSFNINFDDGYRDILKIKDFLKAKGIKPVLFVISNYNETSTKELGNTFEKLTNKDIKQLIKDGWEIGSHGATHRDFWSLSKDELKQEIIDSKNILEDKFGVKIKYFSYPRGRYTAATDELVKRAGYEMAVTMDDGLIDSSTDPYKIPRIGVDKSHDTKQFQQTIIEPVVFTRKFIKNFAGGILRRFI